VAAVKWLEITLSGIRTEASLGLVRERTSHARSTKVTVTVIYRVSLQFIDWRVRDVALHKVKSSLSNHSTAGSEFVPVPAETR
jgi:hypothetical protein